MRKGWSDLSGGIATLITNFDNAIINGNFDIWQRGTSFTSVSSGYTADRWIYLQGLGTGVVDISRSTDVPTFAESDTWSDYSLLIDCTTSEAAIAAGEYSNLQHRIEGYRFRNIAQRGFTYSFWVKATKTGVYGISFKNSADRSCVFEYTINASDTWEKKIINVPASPSAGTWDYDNGIGLTVEYSLAIGSTYHTATTDQWITGLYSSTSNQVNGLDSSSNNFRLAQVQIEPGNVAHRFQVRDFAEELYLCKRYYQKTFIYGTAPAQNVGQNAGAFCGRGTSDGHIGVTWRFEPQMRTSPTITRYNPQAANDDWYNNNDATSRNAATHSKSSEAVLFGTSGTDTSAANDLLFLHADADAEL